MQTNTMNKNQSIGLRDKFVTIEDYRSYDIILFFDCEYTCWEDSLRTMWANPDYPPELLQIGIAIFNLNENKYLDEYFSYVQPIINIKLSRYCINMLNITQEEIDNANDFLTVANEITKFIEPYLKQRLFLCSWGKDYNNVNENAKWNKTKDPFLNIDKMNLMEESKRIFSLKGNNNFRDDIIDRLRLPHNPLRHNALSDAIELLSILEALRNFSE